MNHLNLTVTDVHAATAFLKTYFDLDQRAERPGMAILTDEDEFVLTLMEDEFVQTFMETDEQRAVSYPNMFHIGFLVDSKAAVDDIHNRLTENGFDVQNSLTEDGSDGDTPTQRHTYGFYVEAPGEFTVEVGTLAI